MLCREIRSAEKNGVCLHTVFLLMKREIEGRKAFIFWQNPTPVHEYLLLLPDYLLCEECVKGSWSCLREHGEKVWSEAVNHLEEAFTIQVTWGRFIRLQKGSNHRKHYIYTSPVKLLCISMSIYTSQRTRRSPNPSILEQRFVVTVRVIRHQAARLTSGQKLNIHTQSAPQGCAVFTSCQLRHSQ